MFQPPEFNIQVNLAWAKWRHLMGGINAEKSHETIFQNMVHHFKSIHRDYHTLWRVLNLLDAFDALPAELRKNSLAIKLAVWYHNSVFHPGAPNNTEESVKACMRDMRELKMHEEVVIQPTVRLIWATGHGRPPSQDDERMISDLDWLVLGSCPIDYETYVENIRSEGRFIDRERFNAKRKLFLEQRLSEGVFHTKHFKDRLEEFARLNITRELATLT